MSELLIRAATAGDAAQILRFIKALAVYEKLEHMVVADEAQLRKTLFGERPSAEVRIAEWAGEPAGFALFFHNYSTFLGKPGIYLEDLYVRPTARGAGLGKALLGRLAGLAVERGCGRLEWAVLDWNQPAIGFYQRLGAEPLDDWTQYRLTGPALRDLAEKAL